MQSTLITQELSKASKRVCHGGVTTNDIHRAPLDFSKCKPYCFVTAKASSRQTGANRRLRVAQRDMPRGSRSGGCCTRRDSKALFPPSKQLGHLVFVTSRVPSAKLR